MKEIKLTLIKSKDGYKIINESESMISFATDDDDGRQSVISTLVHEFLNKEVSGGRKYK